MSFNVTIMLVCFLCNFLCSHSKRVPPYGSCGKDCPLCIFLRAASVIRAWQKSSILLHGVLCSLHNLPMWRVLGDCFFNNYLSVISVKLKTALCLFFFIEETVVLFSLSPVKITESGELVHLGYLLKKTTKSWVYLDYEPSRSDFFKEISPLLYIWIRVPCVLKNGLLKSILFWCWDGRFISLQLHNILNEYYGNKWGEWQVNQL